MSSKRTQVVTIGIMLSLFMAAIEGTVVATAMPTIIAELGGLKHYSWVFSAYMLTATTMVPLYGKLSDIYGRRPIFFISMALFLGGSMLSGLSASMGQLIAFRALQGLGAGGLMPLAFIMIGDMFTFEQRARMQGLFSGVWGVASIIGPLLGGFLVDRLTWHWVFYVNVAPGLFATLLVGSAWREQVQRRTGADRPAVDYAGTVLLTAAIVALLLGLFQLGTLYGTLLIISAGVLFVVLMLVERRAADPVLPLALFRQRLFAVTTAQGLLASWSMFGSTNYVPLFGQAILGVSATLAGVTLTPMSLSWTAASIIGSRLLLRLGYRTIALAGMASLIIGSLLMAYLTAATTSASALPLVMFSLGLMGVGMGLSVPAFLIAVQSSVPRQMLGAATAGVQFSREIGGTVGVSIMGVILAAGLTANLTAAGIDTNTVALDELINLGPQSTAASVLDLAVRDALGGAIHNLFLTSLAVAVLAFGVTMLAPRDRIARRSQEVPANISEASGGD
ncbi:MAG: Multidrug resistance protein 3 [Chloroflexi bacterium ADurb.Bin325]|nr:MAG: Multidrug resistance protein 3 [Chloroflexi bacterium ADurb.Bin325]